MLLYPNAKMSIFCYDNSVSIPNYSLKICFPYFIFGKGEHHPVYIFDCYEIFFDKMKYVKPKGDNYNFYPTARILLKVHKKL